MPFSLPSSLLTAAAAFTGTIVGNGLRLFVTAKVEHDEKVRFGVPTDDEQRVTITGVVSAAVAATALAHAFASRRPLLGFLLGAGIGAATGDAPDRTILDLFATEPEGFVPMQPEEIPDGV